MSNEILIARENGVLTMKCAYAKGTGGMFSDNDIRKLLTDRL